MHGKTNRAKNATSRDPCSSTNDKVEHVFNAAIAHDYGPDIYILARDIN